MPIINPTATTASEHTIAHQVEMLLSQMTLEQKIGQVLAIGFDSPEFDPGLEEMI